MARSVKRRDKPSRLAQRTASVNLQFALPILVSAQTDSTASASAPRASSAAHRVVPVTARLATVADSLDSNLESCCDPTMSASRSNPGAFFAPKWHSQLAWNQCEP